ncbi:hypothetical protein GF420_05755 [candidate division GN15 bacterium]|nr:hypothetical protein [candidate division GN15 bacterium]
MKQLICMLAGLLLAGAGFGSIDTDEPVDTNTAFYEGESLNYVFHPPASFKMVSRAAQDDGYSFAFVPNDASYDSSEVLIGVNIYKIRKLDIDEVIEADTANLRLHYGGDVEIHEVDSIQAYNGDPARTFYINSPERYLPNVMIAYVNGETELIIFELVIAETAVRFAAEEKFVGAIRNLRIMPKRELDLGSR